MSEKPLAFISRKAKPIDWQARYWESERQRLELERRVKQLEAVVDSIEALMRERAS